MVFTICRIHYKIQGYAPQIMDEDIFSHFAYLVSIKYEIINEHHSLLKWIELVQTQNKILDFLKKA